jgi:hypothetical protein
MLLLLLRRCPTAILFTVITVVVDTIERAAVRALAHVGEEVLEREPSTANFDAATSVVGEPRVCRPSASSNHTGPSFVRRCVPSTARMTVLERRVGVI